MYGIHAALASPRRITCAVISMQPMSTILFQQGTCIILLCLHVHITICLRLQTFVVPDHPLSYILIAGMSLTLFLEILFSMVLLDRVFFRQILKDALFSPLAC